MASQTKSLKLPADLIDIAESLAKRHGYPSWNAYVKGLIRYDALIQKPHALTVPWSRLSDDEQAKIDATLLEIVNSGEGVKGQYFERAVQRLGVERMQNGDLKG